MKDLVIVAVLVGIFACGSRSVDRLERLEASDAGVAPCTSPYTATYSATHCAVLVETDAGTFAMPLSDFEGRGDAGTLSCWGVDYNFLDVPCEADVYKLVEEAEKEDPQRPPGIRFDRFDE